MKLAKRRTIGRRIKPKIDKNKARSLLTYKYITTTAGSGKRVIKIVEKLVSYLNKEDKRGFLKQIQDRGLYRDLQKFEFPKNGGAVKKQKVQSRVGDNAEMIKLTLTCKPLAKVETSTTQEVSVKQKTKTKDKAIKEN